MIEKIARRAGGFASTTALRWMGAGRDAVAEVAPVSGNGDRKHGGRALAGAAGAIAVISSSKLVRSGVERGLRAAASALRSSPATNGNGSNGLTEKTRAELYELAKKADLPGRSTMSKDELARALEG
jgi:hypothetical protein